MRSLVDIIKLIATVDQSQNLIQVLTERKTFLLILGGILLLFGVLGKIEVKEFKFDLGSLGRGLALAFGTVLLITSFLWESPNITDDSQLKEILAQGYKQLQSAKNIDDYKIAARFYERATDINDSSADAWNGLGMAKDLLGENDAAITAFKKAIKHAGNNPNNATFNNNLGNVYIKTSRFSDAVHPLELATQIDSNSPAWSGLGIAKCHIQKYTDAINALEKSKSISGLNSTSEEYLAKTIQARSSNNPSLCPVP
jgi:Flp pilus assembly protein TadD